MASSATKLMFLFYTQTAVTDHSSLFTQGRERKTEALQQNIKLHVGFNVHLTILNPKYKQDTSCSLLHFRLLGGKIDLKTEIFSKPAVK